MLVKFLFCLNCTILIEGATEIQNAVRHMKLYCMIFVISSFVRKEGVSKELQRRECLSITAALLYKKFNAWDNKKYETPVSIIRLHL